MEGSIRRKAANGTAPTQKSNTNDDEWWGLNGSAHRRVATTPMYIGTRLKPLKLAGPTHFWTIGTSEHKKLMLNRARLAAAPLLVE
ncbi:hypothetical protein PRUPE_1G326700 [Prunus persica]|uniref:Uncharacterized protein n=1 Tax=Prunus persica TaxID=3760 RepID=A0A251R9E6_PRUPE|nr:hypothetical protein PRUPE_1G326700 [Prunus persica]